MISGMDVEQIKDYIGTGQFKQAEEAWMNALNDRVDPAAVGKVLSILVEAGQTDSAETMGWALLDAHADAPPDETLAVAQAALLAVPDSDELRSQVAELLKQNWAGRPRFEELYQTAGLETGQRPERALRTLETCLALHEALAEQDDSQPVAMINRYDGRLVEVHRYNDVMEVFEYIDDGQREQLEPRRLADEFELLPPEDYRVLRQRDPDALAEKILKEPADALINLCQAHGGQIDSDRLKELLDGEILPAGKWSGWWSRARSAAKKTPHLTLEGRSPTIVVYYPGGQSLEDELQTELEKAYEPEDKLDLLRTYLNEAGTRNLQPDPAFLKRITDELAAQVSKWSANRPIEALTASLAVREALRLGAPEPAGHPTPADLLAKTKQPADVLVHLADEALWNAGLDALGQCPDAEDQLVELLSTASADQLPRVVDELLQRGRGEELQQAVDNALASPLDGVELLRWVWAGGDERLPQPPEPVAVLSKLLSVLLEVDATVTLDRNVRKRIRQRVRNALAENSFGRFKTVIAEVAEEMASVLKGYIERTDGLAVAAQEQMLQILREHHPMLFVKAKVQPWEDENILWTTEAALHAHEEELRVLVEEAMPANAKQIGEAAEEGDLRENADWQAAIEERDMLVARQRRMQNDLARARTFDKHDVPTDHVGIGSKATLKNLTTGSEVDLSFLGPWDSDPDHRIYAYTTRLAQQLMGQPTGATVTLDLGEGETLYEISKLDSAV